MDEVSFIKPNLQRFLISTIIGRLMGFLILVCVAYFITSLSELNLNYVIFIIAVIILFIVFSLGTIFSLISFKSINYLFRDSEIEFEKTEFSEEFVAIPHNQITDIKLSQSFIMDRLFKTGSIGIQTAGTNGTDLTLSNINNSTEVFEHMKEIVSDSKDFTPLLKIKPNVKYGMISATISTIIPLGILFLTSGGISLVTLFASPALGIFVSFITMILILGVILSFILYKKQLERIEYIFYSTDIEFFDGFLNRKRTFLEMKRITNASSEQTFIDRIFGTHTLHLDTAGSVGNAITLTFISNGEEVLRKIQEILRKEGKN